MPTTTIRCAAAILVTMISGAALAAPCAGFNDVDSASQFCPNVEWVRNRSVTLGCAAGAYCPGDAVSRLAMAAFMNRLGTALTPVQLRVDASPGSLDLDANVVTCQTGVFAVTGFPRRAIIDAVLNATAPADVGLAADPVMTIDGGANWTLVTGASNRGNVPANRWSSLAQVGHVELEVGQAVRFGILGSRDGLPGTADLSDSRCQLRVLIFSRDGTNSPF